MSNNTPGSRSCQKEVIDFLSDPNSFRHKTDDPAIMETNQSMVFLWGRFAYKLFKAADTGIRDNTELANRFDNAKLEMKANRRLAGELYLGILPIVRTAKGTLAFARKNDTRPIVDYVVRMRRFKQEDMFYNRLFNNKISPQTAYDLGVVVGRFHSCQPLCDDKSLRGYEPFKDSLVTTVLDRSEVLVGKTLPESFYADLREAALKSVEANKGRLNQRTVKSYRIIHGDMDFGNIVLYKGEPMPFDAAVLHPNMRRADMMRDLAYVLAPLYMAGRADLVPYVLEGYTSIRQDNDGLRLLPLWVGYAAVVRGRSWLYRAQTQPRIKDRDLLLERGRAFMKVGLAAFKEELPHIGA